MLLFDDAIGVSSGLTLCPWSSCCFCRHDHWRVAAVNGRQAEYNLTLKALKYVCINHGDQMFF